MSVFSISSVSDQSSTARSLSLSLCLLFCGLCSLFPPTFGADQARSALSPAEALRSFELAPGFRIDLFAAEPLIADPVAMDVDEDGRVYVVEMHGYPLERSRTGAVKLLIDEDGDGLPDRATVFASGLRFPNGVMRWKQGILVTDAPDLIYFEDTDGDGVADLRTVVLTGFAQSNPQHIMNGPVYGLDNWIYLANEPAVTPRIYVEEFGDAGSEIRFPNLPNSGKLPVNANGRRVRLRPDDGRVEALSSATQFGHSFDPWGRQFLVSNSLHIYHEVIAARYLARNPAQLLSSSVASISDHGNAAEVFPITERPEHQMLTAVGVFTSACGIRYYDGGLFPAPYDRVSFVAEPVGNLVHADLIADKGATFTASRLFEGKEFLASRDAWFRPVANVVGPDGALYIVDYYRRIIEHPEWMAKEVAESPHLHDGIDKGRIYRIAPETAAPAAWMKGTPLSHADDSVLIEALGNSNHWQRRTAQRLLVDKYRGKEKSKINDLIAKLTRMAMEDTRRFARLHAAWTLDGLNALDETIVLALLRDPDPGNRENAILLAEPMLAQNPGMQTALLSMREDPEHRAYFQRLCTLGDLDSIEARQALSDALFSSGDAWDQAAIFSARSLDYDALLDRSLELAEKDPRRWMALTERIVTMLCRQADAAGIQKLIARTRANPVTPAETSAAWQVAILAGIAKGANQTILRDPALASERTVLLDQVIGHPRDDVRRASLTLLAVMGLPPGETLERALVQARKTMADSSAKQTDRLISISLLSLAEPGKNEDTLLALIRPEEATEIQKIALETLGTQNRAKLADELLERWPTMTEEIRGVAIGLFLATPERRDALLKALEKGIITPSYLSGGRHIGLIARADTATRARLRAALGLSADGSIEEPVPAEYRAALAKGGSREKGATIYRQHCSACHQLGGKGGTPIGPDLNSIRIREPVAIVSDILEPNRSIADGYALWQITLKDGSEKVGVIVSETGESLTLRLPGATEEILSRQNIAAKKEVGISLMPAGLGHLIPPRDMADLIAYIKNPDESLSPP